VILDNSCASEEIGGELRAFMDRVNSYLGKEWISVRDVGSDAIANPIGFLQTGVLQAGSWSCGTRHSYYRDSAGFSDSMGVQ
jgi:hypothetical protein